MIKNETIIKFQNEETHTFPKNGEGIKEFQKEIFPYASKLSFQTILKHWEKKLVGNDLANSITR